MTIRRLITVTVLALPLAALSAASAVGSSGGASPDVLTLPGPQPTVVRVGNAIARASGQNVSLAVRSSVLLHGSVHVRGTAPASTPGGVRIERLDAVAGWVTVATAPVSPTGAFDAIWKPDHVGATQLRADASAGSATADAAVTPQVAVAVYRRGVASWYGPGLYGTHTACGVVLHHATLGVAHRTLPCGTPVALYYRRRTLVVPVIDRGPYAHGRSWDLTVATLRALGATREDGLLKLGALQVAPALAAPLVAPAPAAG